MPLVESALTGARLRFRPILMTSFAFILGVFPMVISSGAGAGSRHSLGTAVCFGMLAATSMGVFVIPLLYVLIEGLKEKITGKRPATMPAAAGRRQRMKLVRAHRCRRTGRDGVPDRLRRGPELYAARPRRFPRRSATLLPATPQEAASFADLPWWEVFRDPVLQNLIRTALEKNYNLHIAAEQIAAARERVVITHANQLPQVSGAGSYTGGKGLLGAHGNTHSSAHRRCELSARPVRRAAARHEASRAQLLATEEAGRRS